MNVNQDFKCNSLHIPSQLQKDLSRGKIRDRDQEINNLLEEYICSELKLQGVTTVKHFTTKKSGNMLKLNMYLFTFSSKSLPYHICISLYVVTVE